MKFSDKLSKLRKNNNMSQEQLADKLGVSRQAVSKWESGLSYPDMEKIIQICKLLDCNLEDILDDGVIGNTKKDKMDTNANVFDDFLNYVTKTYNMFCSMTFKDKIKCLLELFLLGLTLFVVAYILSNFIDSILFYFISFSTNPVLTVVRNIINSIMYLALFALGVVIILHIFKIRYLDYYVTISDKHVEKQTIERPIEKLDDNKREKVIIRDPNHASSTFIDGLASAIAVIIKGLVLCFSIPVCIFFVIMIFVSVLLLCYTSYGSIFPLTLIAAIGVLLFTFIIIKIIYYFIFNRKNNHIFNFSIIIISFILMGVGSALASNVLATFNVIDAGESKLEKKETYEISYQDNLIMNELLEDYVIDNTKKDITIESYCTDYATPRLHSYEYSVNDYEYKIFGIYYNYNDFNVFRNFLNHIKNKEIIVNNAECKNKAILSEEIYNKLKSNHEKMQSDDEFYLE